MVWSISVTTILSPLAMCVPVKCGFRGSLHVMELAGRSILFDGHLAYEPHLKPVMDWWWYGTSHCMAAWDVTTLLLYCWKIWKIRGALKSKLQVVWKNVLFILQRVVIMTVFYEICFVVGRVVSFTKLQALNKGWITRDTFSALNPLQIVIQIVGVSTSMYLMMDHNTNKYIVFLRFLQKSYLKHACFCCCHRMVDQQLESYKVQAIEVI